MSTSVIMPALELAQETGWEFGGPHSGHLVGEFPHELSEGGKNITRLFVTRELDTYLSQPPQKSVVGSLEI